MQILRQSTEIKVRIGPFVAVGDAFTPLTTVTLSAADQAELLKNNGAATVSISAATWAAITGSDGWYDLTLTVSHLDTVGLLEVVVQDASLCLPVFARFQVIDTEAFDSIYANAAPSIATAASITALKDFDPAADDVAVVTLTSTVTDVTNTVNSDIVAITGGDAGPADNLELMYNGTGYTDETAPSSRAQLDNISTGSAAISTVADNVANVTGTETGTVANTTALDGTIYSIAINGTINVEFIFSVGSVGIPTEIIWDGYFQSQGDSTTVKMWNYNTLAWDQVGLISGASGTTVYNKIFQATTSYVSTDGEVKVQFNSIDGVILAFDRILCSYAVVNQSVGYSLGAIWVDDSATNESTVNYADGTADNPVSTWAAALTLSGQLGLKNFNIANGTSITLTAAITEFSLFGSGWTLALASQIIGGAYITGAVITGIGLAGAVPPKFDRCSFGAVSLPPCSMKDCGYGKDSGLFSGNAAGEYTLNNPRSLVAGTGTPVYNFSGLLSATSIVTHNYSGGANFTLDSNCTISHNVSGGGGTTFTTAGATVEIRGMPREITLNLSGNESVQFIGVTGPINITGASTGAEVNLYGVSASLTNTSSGSMVPNDETVSAEVVNAILGDTTEIGIAGAGLTDLGGMSNAMKDEINAEFIDVLSVDTHAEPGQGAPGETISIEQKIAYLYKAWRNKTEQTSTTLSLYGDAGTTVDQKTTVADDGTTASRNEIVSGP